MPKNFLNLHISLFHLLFVPLSRKISPIQAFSYIHYYKPLFVFFSIVWFVYGIISNRHCNTYKIGFRRITTFVICRLPSHLLFKCIRCIRNRQIHFVILFQFATITNILTNTVQLNFPRSCLVSVEVLIP